MAWNNELLDEMTALLDFRNMFSVIDQTYQSLNLGKDMTDEEKIEEYSWINQQMRKFAGSKKTYLADKRNYEEVVHQIEDWLTNSNEYGKSRKELIYGFLRDQMLVEWANIINAYYDDEEEEEE